MSDFDLVLRLIDFSSPRDVLAQRLGWTSARGHVPFDPVSIFLLIGRQLVNGWNRLQLLKNLRNPHYADYARLFGFRDGIFTEGGLRHRLTALGHHSQNGDTVTVPVDEDKLVEVAVEYLNQLIAQSVTLLLEGGFLSPQAWEEALRGPFCRPTPPTGFSLPLLHVRDVVGDAAFGYSCVLRVVHEHLDARRVIDLRAHQTDQDKTLWPLRGYDDKGRPICAYGYPFTSNGFDFEKRRHKWFCDHVCQKGQEPVVVIPGLPTPISECPYLHTDSNYGQILNVGLSFKNDGSCRLVRDIAVDSPAWKQLYHRARNASESAATPPSSAGA